MTSYTSMHRNLARALFPHLDNFAEAGGPEWQMAIRLRERAFHQAGHLWAGYLLHCDTGSTLLDGCALPAVGAFDPHDRARLGAAGLLAAAAFPLADGALEVDGAVVPPLMDEDLVVDSLDAVAHCGRGVDGEAQALLAEREAAREWLQPLLEDWSSLHKLAMLLIEGTTLTSSDVFAVMQGSVHQIPKWQLGALEESMAERDSVGVETAASRGRADSPGDASKVARDTRAPNLRLVSRTPEDF